MHVPTLKSVNQCLNRRCALTRGDGRWLVCNRRMQTARGPAWGRRALMDLCFPHVRAARPVSASGSFSPSFTTYNICSVDLAEALQSTLLPAIADSMSAKSSRWSLTRLLSGDAQQRTRAQSNSPTQSRNDPRIQPARSSSSQISQTSQTSQTSPTPLRLQGSESHRSPQTQNSTQQTSPRNHQASYSQTSSRSNSSFASSGSNTRIRAQAHRSHRDGPTKFSTMSSHAVPDSLFFAEDFMLGSGIVIIQPSTGKIVLLRDTELDAQGRTYYRWFLPKGRKDIGETLEQTALREAYEEVRQQALPRVCYPVSCSSLCDVHGLHLHACLLCTHIATADMLLVRLSCRVSPGRHEAQCPHASNVFGSASHVSCH